MEQAGSFRDLAQDSDLSAASGLAEDRYIIGITAKAGNIISHPAKGFNQISHAHIDTVMIFFSEIRQIQITESIEPVVHTNNDHVIQFGQIETIIADLLDGRTSRITAAMDPEHDWSLGCRIAALRPDVQILAVFRSRPETMRRHNLSGRHRVREHRADHTVTASILNAFPGRNRLRHVEALRDGVADPVEMIDAIKVKTADLSFGSLDDRRCLGHIKFFHLPILS